MLKTTCVIFLQICSFMLVWDLVFCFMQRREFSCHHVIKLRKESSTLLSLSRHMKQTVHPFKSDSFTWDRNSCSKKKRLSYCDWAIVYTTQASVAAFIICVLDRISQFQLPQRRSWGNTTSSWGAIGCSWKNSPFSPVMWFLIGFPWPIEWANTYANKIKSRLIKLSGLKQVSEFGRETWWWSVSGRN